MALLDIHTYTPLVRRIVVLSQIGVSLMSDVVTSSRAQSDYADVVLLYAVMVFRGPREIGIVLLGHGVMVSVCMACGVLHLPNRTRIVHLVCLRALLLVCSVWIAPGPIVARAQAPPTATTPDVTPEVKQ